MTANDKRRLNYLWERRHNPFDDSDLQTQIDVINNTITDQVLNVGAGTGARIHLKLEAAQTIAVSGENVDWTAEDDLATRVDFAAPSFPTDSTTIIKPGYYGALLQDFEWDTWAGAGTVRVIRTRDSVDSVVKEWSGQTSGAKGEGLAVIPDCRNGDIIKVFVDHEDSSTQDLATAELVLFLIDREQGQTSGEWVQIWSLSDHWGIAFDGSSWWTSDPTTAANPALFERDADGTVLNSYAGWDDGNGSPAAAVNASLQYAAGFLWGSGQSDDPMLSKIDPSDGSIDGTMSPNTGGTHGWLGVGYDGTNLFTASSHSGDLYIEEYTLAGSFIAQTAYPGSHVLASLVWDGGGWWAPTTAGVIVRMDASFTEITTIEGPTAGANYGGVLGSGPYGDCEFVNGHLYVMTRDGLWRKRI